MVELLLSELLIPFYYSLLLQCVSSAALAVVEMSVCLSLRLSFAGIVSQRCKLWSWNLHWWSL